MVCLAAQLTKIGPEAEVVHLHAHGSAESSEPLQATWPSSLGEHERRHDKAEGHKEDISSLCRSPGTPLGTPTRRRYGLKAVLSCHAGDVAGLWRGEKDDDVGDFAWERHATHRDPIDAPAARLVEADVAEPRVRRLPFGVSPVCYPKCFLKNAVARPQANKDPVFGVIGQGVDGRSDPQGPISVRAPPDCRLSVRQNSPGTGAREHRCVLLPSFSAISNNRIS